MKRTCLFLLAVMAFCALFTAAAMCNAGPLGLFRNDSNMGSQASAPQWVPVEVATPAVPAVRVKAKQVSEVKAEIARPEDSYKNYLTVLGDADEAVVNKLRDSFPDAHFHHYSNGDPILPRYEKTVGTFPAVVYQKPNGVVIEKLSGASFPTSQRELTGFVEQCRPFRPKPEPTPPVQPTPPVIVPTPGPVPDTSGEGDASVLLYIVLAALGAAGSAGYGWYKEIKGE